MHYKVILVILLLPVVNYGSPAQVRDASSIESLKQEKEVMQRRILLLGAKLKHEQDRLIFCRERVFTLLCENRYSKNKGIMSRERFNSFVLQLCEVLAKGEDIKPLVEKAPFYRANTIFPMSSLIKGLARQELLVKSLSDEYDKETEKLGLLNKDLGSKF